MLVIEGKAEMRAWTRARRADGLTVGFVPTMGFLHEGHLSLVRQASARCDRVVVSIYVNPTQFAPNEDFDVYPRDSEGDLQKLQSLGVDAVFMPTDLYDGGQDRGACRTWVEVSQLTTTLCGASRPHFFRGVTTVVTKLFNIVEPDIAVFGQKDYQQWRVIDKMVKGLDIPVEIVRMPIAREPDGLAMSSRNARLSPASRRAAVALPQALGQAAQEISQGHTSIPAAKTRLIAALEHSGAEVDYVEVVDGLTLHPTDSSTSVMLLAAAASYDGVRLIDNIELFIEADPQGAQG